jgi:hypothetical protein
MSNALAAKRVEIVIVTLRLYGLLAHWAEIADAPWLPTLLQWEEDEHIRRSLERRMKSAGCVVSLVDRLVHRSEVIAIEGKSYRGVGDSYFGGLGGRRRRWLRSEAPGETGAAPLGMGKGGSDYRTKAVGSVYVSG